MSQPVDVTELADQLRHYDFAYLLTVTDDRRAHAVAVRPTLDGPVLQVDGLGRRTRENVDARPDVSLVWPPYEPGGYSLIVDGRAALRDAGLELTPTHAVLHRSADDGDGSGESSSESGCASDCVPVGEG
jgi:hypothetical protein